MALLQHQVHLPYLSGLPRDVAVNTFWTTNTTGSAVDAATAAHSALIEFYNNAESPADPIAYWLSPIIDRSVDACYIKTYNYDLPKPRSPILQTNFTLGNSGNTAGLPLEVALTVSFRASYPSGVNPQRRRGRIYLGPMNLSAMATGVSGQNFPDPACVTACADAAQVLASTLSTAAAQLVIYSRVSSSSAEVIAGWVDNEWDTQRRRQTEATSRTTWSLLP